MELSSINNIIQSFTLNQRAVSCHFRKDHGLNRTHVEILTFANSVVCFNAYELHKRYPEINMQQIRLGIRKIVSERFIELISSGVKGKPAVYMITSKGRHMLKEYVQYWQRTFDIVTH